MNQLIEDIARGSGAVAVITTPLNQHDGCARKDGSIQFLENLMGKQSGLLRYVLLSCGDSKQSFTDFCHANKSEEHISHTSCVPALAPAVGRDVTFVTVTVVFLFLAH